MSQPCALYRHYDKRGRLLYVGISLSAVHRLSQHRDKPWFTSIANMTTEWLPSREAAVAAEIAAIKGERPKHNVKHRPAKRISARAAAMNDEAVKDRSRAMIADLRKKMHARYEEAMDQLLHPERYPTPSASREVMAP